MIRSHRGNLFIWPSLWSPQLGSYFRVSYVSPICRYVTSPAESTPFPSSPSPSIQVFSHSITPSDLPLWPHKRLLLSLPWSNPRFAVVKFSGGRGVWCSPTVRSRRKRKGEKALCIFSNGCLETTGYWGYVFFFYYYYWVTSVVSDSVRPQRWQPTRIPPPWDSPGKNTGVGCHCLLHIFF